MKQLFVCRSLGKSPVVHFVRKELVAKATLEHFFLTALVEHFLGREIGKEFLYVVRNAFGHQKFAGRDVKQRKPHRAAPEVNGRQEVVFLAVEHIVVHRHARRYKFRNAALDKLVGGFRVLQLVTDGHTMAGAYQLGQIRVEGMKREARHVNSGSLPLIVTLGQGNSQNL
ncbi:unknown [Prevotella sp. CAG:617]|nr:unknown [Prevotella sp. CAG:617]